MSDKLGQSLDEIMKSNNSGRSGGRRRPGRTAAAKAKAAISAPAGGIQKKNHNRGANKPNAPAVLGADPSSRGDSKVIVSNLPADVSESDVKGLFTKTFGSVKKVQISYGPNGRSRGEAHITFSKPDIAAQAVSSFNGIKVDNKPIKVEVVGVPLVSVPTPKALSERISNKPKSATGPKKATNGAGAVAGTAKAKGGKDNKKARSGRPGRPKPKSKEDLDVDMDAYFQTGAPAAPVNGVAETNGGDTGMTDEVL